MVKTKTFCRYSAKLLITIFIAIAAVVCSITDNSVCAISCRKSGFNTSAYSGKLVGDVAKDAATIAVSQNGRAGAQFGYTEEWCDEFVADCLELAGAGSAVKHGGTVTNFYDAMVKCGATAVSKSNAKVGDLAFGTGHVEIIWKISNGTIYTVGGNINVTGSQNSYSTRRVYKRENAAGQSYFTFSKVLRPAYPSSTPTVTLSSISVATSPMTLVYEDGSTFNPAEMVIKATYSDGSSKNVTGYKTSYDFSSEGDKNVTISYTENGVTKSTTQQVSVQDMFQGSGTDADPYKINHVGDLLVLMDQVNNIRANGCYGEASYIQTADIVVDEMPEPIGSFYENSSSTTITNYAAFNGHYNGNYHKLTNFIINNKRLYTGVFGRINKNAVIENLSVSGSVTGTSSCVGGIVGEQGYGSIVRNCDFSGTVKGKSMVGGISGKVQGGGTISSCYANADVTATGDTGAAGGIVGYVRVGNNASSADMLCESSYFAGTVTGVSTGGICGAIDIQTTKECTVTFSKAYYLNTAAGGAVNGAGMTGCAGVYASTLKNMASGLSDVFVNSTEAVNDGYPVFVWQTPAPFAGSGTEEDPYQISSKKDLENMRDLVNNTMTNHVYGLAYYIQTADIDLENENWIPIGSYYENDTSTVENKKAAFNGNYNGNCHTIKNLYVNTTRSYGGLFGRGNSTCFIYDLAVEGNVSSGDNYTGGVIGAVCWGARVQGCSFNGTVTSLYNTGGITGIIHQGGSVVDCYANAEVTATNSTYGYAGGITGYARTGSNDVTCQSVEISNCYFAGKTNGKARNGGITCGVESLSGTYQPQLIVDNCYYASTASAGAVNSASYSGCLAMSESQLKLAAESLGYAYVNNTNDSLNNGYPVFEWQLADLRGDINLDGTVDVADMVILQQYLTRMLFVNDDEYIADVTGDGIVNVFDYIIVRRMIL